MIYKLTLIIFAINYNSSVLLTYILFFSNLIIVSYKDKKNLILRV